MNWKTKIKRLRTIVNTGNRETVITAFWLMLSAGQPIPGKALAASGLTNPFDFLNSGAATVETRNSFDVVVATGWRF